MSKPWSPFAVGLPAASGSRFTPPNCQPLTRLSHVAHLPLALRIVEDGAVRANLISDESKLRDRRICVSWLSPNDWTGAGGFRYGHIRFTFDAEEILNGRRAYWVETMKYGIPASRILITELEHPDLDEYDPDKRGGPWWRDQDGEHLWNGDGHCLEFMFEGDVLLTKATSVDFVGHHPSMCSLRANACKYRRESDYEVGARFLSALASHCVVFRLPGLLGHDGVPTHSVRMAINHVLRTLRDKNCSAASNASPTGKTALALGRAALNAYARDLIGDLDRVADLFSHHVELQLAVIGVLAKALGIKDPEAVDLLPVADRRKRA